MSFSPEDFAIDYDSDNCSATICSLNEGLNISGHLLDTCCNTSPTVTKIPNARNIKFGRGLHITDYSAGKKRMNAVSPVKKDGWK